MGDKVTPIAGDFVSTERFEREGQERRHEMRRLSDRVTLCESENHRHSVVLFGDESETGMRTEVALHAHTIATHQKILWALGGSLVTGIVGLLVKALSG